MALPANEVKKAVSILTELLGNKKKVPSFKSIDLDLPISQEHCNAILYFGRVQDGWESVSIMVTEFDSIQFDSWERRKKDVSNSSFTSLKNGILTLGFF